MAEDIKKILEDYKEKTERHFDEKTEETKRHFDEKTEEAKRHFNEKIEETKRHFDGKTEETKRHFDVVAEDFKSEIGILAEQVAANTEKLEEHDQRFNKIDDTLEVIKLDIEFIKNDLKQKVGRDEFAILEKRISMLEARQR